MSRRIRPGERDRLVQWLDTLPIAEVRRRSRLTIRTLARLADVVERERAVAAARIAAIAAADAAAEAEATAAAAATPAPASVAPIARTSSYHDRGRNASRSLLPDAPCFQCGSRGWCGHAGRLAA